MALIRWDPFRDLDRILEEGMPMSAGQSAQLGWDLAVDVYEEGDDVIAKLNLPGVDPKKLDITVEEDKLQVSGSREDEQEVDKKNYYSKEIRRGSFERAVRLPVPVSSEGSQAKYDEGVLTVTMPKLKPEAKESRKIEVET